MKLAIVAGEASGDLHAAHVLRELRKLDPAVTTFGIGGDLLAAEGMQILHHAREMGIVGLFNVIRHLGMFRRVFRELIERIERERPDAVLLVDYPDFNLRLAGKCKALGLRVIYFISPQVWAWRQKRVRDIARTVDHMIVLFPFEEEFYRKHRVPVTYVGHPLIDQTVTITRAPRETDVTRIALMPGSRKREVDDLLPPMLEAVKILSKERPIKAFVIKAPTIARKQLGDSVDVVEHDGGQALASADLALSSSGTATLEAAVIGTPVVVMYRLGRATYWLARRLVKVPHFSLVNIIAGRKVVPELLQDEVTGERIAAEVRAILEPARYQQMTADLAAVKARLGEPGAARRAAEAIMAAVAR
jgi:lipid-A-disaccharide synthase